MSKSHVSNEGVLGLALLRMCSVVSCTIGLFTKLSVNRNPSPDSTVRVEQYTWPRASFLQQTLVLTPTFASIELQLTTWPIVWRCMDYCMLWWLHIQYIHFINPRRAHAQRGLRYLVCVSVCVSVCLSVSTYSRITGTKRAHEQYQRL